VRKVKNGSGYLKQLPIIYNRFNQKRLFERLIMLMAIDAGRVLEAIFNIFFLLLFIRGLLLAGRLVRAIEKIVEKGEK
jgi:hypothetical protein